MVSLATGDGETSCTMSTAALLGPIKLMTACLNEDLAAALDTIGAP